MSSTNVFLRVLVHKQTRIVAKKEDGALLVEQQDAREDKMNTMKALHKTYKMNDWIDYAVLVLKMQSFIKNALGVTPNNEPWGKATYWRTPSAQAHKTISLRLFALYTIHLDPKED